MNTLTLSVWLLILAPLAGAGLVLVPPARNGNRHSVRAWTTLAALAMTVAAVALALISGGIIGLPGRHAMDLGPLDPAQPFGALVWSIAPVLIAFLFMAIAMGTRSRLLIALALGQLAVAIVAASAEPLIPPRATFTATPGGSLVIDPLAGLLLMVSAGVGGLIVLYALGYEPGHLAHRGLPVERTSAFLAWLLLFLAAMNLLVLADDLRVLTVGWELTTLCSFALIGFDQDAEAVVAARRALAYNLAGGIALGFAAVVAGPGATLSGILADSAGTSAVGGVALPLALAGFILAAATKSALVPFHPWLLGAMVAAAPVSALLHASTMVKAGSYLLLRLSPAFTAQPLIGPAVALLGGFAFATAAMLALRERDLKRVLALSTISSLGLIAAAAGLSSPAALAAGVILLAFHAMAKALAFLAAGAIEQVSGTRDLEALVGAARARPGIAGLLLLAAGALTLPPFGIVVAKWAILVLGATDLALVVLLAIGGAAGLALWTAVASRLLVRPSGRDAPALRGPLPASERAALGALGIGTVAGLILVAPVARLVADPAAIVAFGREAGLAAGWSIALAGAGFAVPAIGLLVVLSVLVATVVARRLPSIAPQPYLAGANVSAGPSTVFHGVKGQPVRAGGGGFYWGDALGGGDRPLGLRRLALVGGWVAVVIVALATFVASWNGGRP